MFGVTWRAAFTALFSAFGTAVFLRILDPIVEFMEHPNHWLVQSFEVLAGNILLISILSAMLMWLVASITGREGAGAGQMKRITYGYTVTLSNALVALMHFRVGYPLYDLATGQFSGSFTPVVELLQVTVPVVVGIIIASTWLWVLISPWQRERRRRRQQGQAVVGGGPR